MFADQFLGHFVGNFLETGSPHQLAENKETQEEHKQFGENNSK